MSIARGGKVVELYFSDGLRDIRAIHAMHQDCEVEAMMVGKYRDPEAIEPVYVRADDCRRTAKRVRCKETGEVFSSVSSCSSEIGVSRWVVYKAIQRGLSVDGRHYNYYNE